MIFVLRFDKFVVEFDVWFLILIFFKLIFIYGVNIKKKNLLWILLDEMCVERVF